MERFLTDAVVARLFEARMTATERRSQLGESPPEANQMAETISLSATLREITCNRLRVRKHRQREYDDVIVGDCLTEFPKPARDWLVENGWLSETKQTTRGRWPMRIRNYCAAWRRGLSRSHLNPEPTIDVLPRSILKPYCRTLAISIARQIIGWLTLLQYPTARNCKGGPTCALRGFLGGQNLLATGQGIYDGRRYQTHRLSVARAYSECSGGPSAAGPPASA